MSMEMIDQNKQYRVYLVEVDDEDRERVVSGLVGSVEISSDPQYADIHTHDSYFPVSRFVESTTYRMNIVLRPREDGTVLTIENFAEDDNEYDED